MVFTDLIEANWLHLKNASLDTDWQPQNFSVDPQDSHGPYGRAARVSNVVSNPLKDPYSSSGPSVLGGDAGLQLWVRSTLEGDLVSTAEIDTMRNDILYGSFRAAIKLTGIPGTCGAFFYVRFPKSGISPYVLVGDAASLQNGDLSRSIDLPLLGVSVSVGPLQTPLHASQLLRSSVGCLWDCV
jgi:hypothetical protein